MRAEFQLQEVQRQQGGDVEQKVARAHVMNSEFLVVVDLRCGWYTERRHAAASVMHGME